MIVACSIGGMIGGISKACKQINPNIKVFACEPELANDLTQSFEKGEKVALKGTDYLTLF